MVNEVTCAIPEGLNTIAMGELTAYQNNSRTHSDKQISQIVESILKFGFNNPILIDDSNGIVAGHGRVLAAEKMGLACVPYVRLSHLTAEQKRAYIIADNKIAENSGWDDELLALELGELSALGLDVSVTGFSEDELAGLMIDADAVLSSGDPDAVMDTPAPAAVVSVRGDIWLLGDNRVMCGDATCADDVAKLTGGEVAQLLHADPPYGMGKASEGVLNDNLYNDALDDFQVSWWQTIRPHVADNASAYVWGNAPELWRLWIKRLQPLETMRLCNQIVWDKKSIAGMKSELMKQFPIATEHCLFIQLGKRQHATVNSNEYPKAWDELRLYLSEQAEHANITPKDLLRVCGVSMYSHWFTKSQFTLIPEKHYLTLAEHYNGFFLKPWSELQSIWQRVRSAGMRTKGIDSDPYFDNAHEVMRDVWEFPRVCGGERYGHATPKPVAMMERIMKSSLPPKGLCVEPFGGSGSTLMGAEKSGRRCYAMELQPCYVDIHVQRWQQFTGKPAVNANDGRTFEQTKQQRLGQVEA